MGWLKGPFRPSRTHVLQDFYFVDLNTPHTTTGLIPSELRFGRHVRTHLDLVKPGLTSRVQLRQQQLKLEHGMRTEERSFEVGDKFFVPNFPPKRGTPWDPGQFNAVHGPLLYIIELQDDRLYSAVFISSCVGIRRPD